MLATESRVPSTTATEKVADAGLGESAAVVATIASLAAVTVVAKVAATAAARPCSVPRPFGNGIRSVSRAARAPASEATSESIELDTPSRTTRTARSPGVFAASRAIASSFLPCTMPRSHTPATQVAGVSRKWSRSLGCLVPHDSQ